MQCPKCKNNMDEGLIYHSIPDLMPGGIVTNVNTFWVGKADKTEESLSTVSLNPLKSPSHKAFRCSKCRLVLFGY